jgi:HPt (histidine-containing phosphotransfer) domain-containing protein
MAELRTRFLARARADRALLAIAVRQEDRDEIRRLAHGLSGTAGVFGFASLGKAAEALETAVDEGGDWPDLRRVGAVLLDELEAVQPV